MPITINKTTLKYKDEDGVFHSADCIKGDKGDTGATGTTFTPSVDESGNISWTNDGNKTNPTTVNIKGPKGDTGDPAPAEDVTTAVDAYLAENFTNVDSPPLDRTLASSESAAPADIVGDLKSAINLFSKDNYTFAEIEQDSSADNYELFDNGLCGANTSYKLVKYRVQEGQLVLINSDHKFQFQSIARVPSTPPSNRVGITYGVGNDLYIVPTGANYVVFSTPINGSTISIELATPKVDALEDAKEITVVEVVETETVETPYQDGYYLIASDGTVTQYTSGSSWRVSDPVDISEYSEVLVTGSSGWGNLICAFYDASSTFISGYASGSSMTVVTDQPVSVPSEAKYIRVASYDWSNRPIALKVQTASLKNKAIYKWDSKKWVCIGDSLTEANAATTKHYFDYVSEQTGITVANYGIGGTGYANPNGTAGNFTARMASVPTDADVYTIFGSFNDYAYSISNEIPIGDPTDSGTTTICGYINGAFDALFTRVPLANLGVVAPCPWVSVNSVTGTTSKTFAENYTEALRLCCERRSVPFLDLYHYSGMRPWDSSFEELTYTKDALHGVHPDETGHAILAPKFKAFLESLLM